MRGKKIRGSLAKISILNQSTLAPSRTRGFFFISIDKARPSLLPLAQSRGRHLQWWTPAHLPSAPLNCLGSTERRHTAIGWHEADCSTADSSATCAKLLTEPSPRFCDVVSDLVGLSEASLSIITLTRSQYYTQNVLATPSIGYPCVSPLNSITPLTPHGLRLHEPWPYSSRHPPPQSYR
jgi:hypothetical protein